MSTFEKMWNEMCDFKIAEMEARKKLIEALPASSLDGHGVEPLGVVSRNRINLGVTYQPELMDIIRAEMIEAGWWMHEECKEQATKMGDIYPWQRYKRGPKYDSAGSEVMSLVLEIVYFQCSIWGWSSKVHFGPPDLEDRKKGAK